MTHEQGGIAGSMQQIATYESELATTLSATSKEIAHSECLDFEQRAEVYTIIEAIQADSEVHRKTIKLMSHRLSRGPANA